MKYILKYICIFNDGTFIPWVQIPTSPAKSKSQNRILIQSKDPDPHSHLDLDQDSVPKNADALCPGADDNPDF